eukprot:7657371-Lingulodinium_polyedra.AAC.1
MRVRGGATASSGDDDDSVLGTETLLFNKRLLGVTVRNRRPGGDESGLRGTMAVELEAASLEAPPSSKL